MKIRFKHFSLVGGVAAALVGCSKKEFESQGVIAKVDGQVRALSSEEQARLCDTLHCEPNFVYTINFGRKKKNDPPPPAAPPAPAPPPAAAPATPPGMTVPNRADRIDYSRPILKVVEAWNTTQGSRDIVVAVIDTGVDYNHPDLRGNIAVNLPEKNGQAGVDDDGNGYVDDVYGWDFANNRANGMDDNRHGTHCAGIIGAEMNDVGTVGVSPNVKILPVKFLSAGGSGSTDAAIRAIDYAIARGAHVLSLSWGGGGRSDYLDQAIQRARQQGILVVAAAGNETNPNDTNPNYPSNYSGVIAVGSTDESDQLSPFSNYGPQTVMLAAPGSRIYSAIPNGGYQYLSGTSMATPQVSGALALALSLNQTIDREELKDRLCDTSKKILLGKVKCGRMDVQAFVESI